LHTGSGPSWWIYNYLCNQCLSPLMWVRISIRARCTALCDKVCQWLATGWCFSLGPLVSSTNKTESHDIAEILLKVVLNTIKQSDHDIAEKLLIWHLNYNHYLYFIGIWSTFKYDNGWCWRNSHYCRNWWRNLWRNI
jgi:hypothetical protein